MYSTQIEPFREITTIDHDQGGLKRSLNGRHIAMIAIASGIGTGLFVRDTVLWRHRMSCSYSCSARNRQCTCTSRATGHSDWVRAHGSGCSKGLQRCVIHTESLTLWQAEVSFISAETIGFLPLSGGFMRFVPRFTDKVG